MGYGIFLFFLVVASMVLQEAVTFAGGWLKEWLHPEGDWLGKAKLLVLPACYFPAVLTVPFPAMLLLAFGSGLLWDCGQALVWGAKAPGFGGGPILFGLLGCVVHGARGPFLQGRPLGPLLLAAVAGWAFLLLEFLWFSFRSGDFLFPPGFWLKLGVSGLWTGLAMPVFLAVMVQGMIWCGVENVPGRDGDR